MKRFNEMFWCALHTSLMFLASVALRDHGKRILFVTTIYFQLGRFKNSPSDVLEKLNEAMALARSGSALEAPARLHAYIWDGETINQTIFQICGKDGVYCKILKPSDVAKACDAIVGVTPKWLWYGRREDMLSDLMKLLFTAREVGGVPATA